MTLRLRPTRGAGQGVPAGQRLWAYPREHYAFWNTVRAQLKLADWGAQWSIGSWGEDLSLAGLQEGQVWLGDVWVLPNLQLRVCAAYQPGDAVNHAAGFAKAAQLMRQSRWTGWWLEATNDGALPSDEVAFAVQAGPREVSLRELAQVSG